MQQSAIAGACAEEDLPSAHVQRRSATAEAPELHDYEHYDA